MPIPIRCLSARPRPPSPRGRWALLVLVAWTLAPACGAPVLPAAPAAPAASTRPAPQARAMAQLPDMGAVPQSVSPAADASALWHMQGDVIALRRAALGRPWLLRPQSIMASHTPRVVLGTPKIVAFAKAQGQLALLEPALHAIYGGLPNERLLETFCVLREDADFIYFRWPFGLHAVPVRAPYALSDVPGTVADYLTAQDDVLPVQSAFMRDVHITGDTLIAHQVARVQVERLPWSLLDLFADTLALQPAEVTLHIAFSLSPLQNNAHFAPQVQGRAAIPYYLQMAQRRPQGAAIDYLNLRWDDNPDAGPIVFDLAPDLPPDLVPAVAQGVLYWNRVAQRELVAVAHGEHAGLLAHARHVPLRWIPWSQAGFSVAEVQANPLTGEMLAAEIFLTSAFGEPSSRFLAVAASLDQAGVDALPAPSAPARGHACAPAQAPMWSLATRAPPGSTHDLVRRAMMDHVRLTVAHEVGHVLGLRHNFAGSLQSSLPTTHARARAWDAYGQGEAAGAATSSSVMDYTGEVDSFLLGAFIRDGALPYDAEAIARGYTTPLGPPSGPSPWLFCSDGEREQGVLGCREFDSGPNPFAGALYEAQMAHRHLPQQLLVTLAKRLHPEGDGDRLSFEQIARNMAPEPFSQYVARITQDLFAGLRHRVRVLPVERTVGHLRHVDPNTYETAGLAQRAAWLADVDGLPGIVRGILASPTPADSAAGSADPNLVAGLGWMAAAVSQELDAAERTHTLIAGQPITLAPDQLTFLREFAPRWAEAIEQAVLRDVILTLTGGVPQSQNSSAQGWLAPLLALNADTSGMDRALVDPAWEPVFASMAQALVLATAGAHDDVVDGVATQVPIARLQLTTRLAALRLLAPEVFHTSTWGKSARDALALRLTERLLAMVAPPSQLTPDLVNVMRTLGPAAIEDYLRPATLSPALRAWALGELLVLRAVIATGTPPRPTEQKIGLGVSP